MATEAGVTHVDMSRHVRYLWVIRLVDYGLILSSIHVLLQCAIAVVVAALESEKEVSGEDLAGVVIAAGLAGWFLHVGLRNVGTAVSRKWRSYTVALGAALISCLLIGAVNLAAGNVQGTVLGAYFLFYALWVVAALYAVSRVRSLRIPGTNLNLKTLRRTMADDGREASAASDLLRVKRVNKAGGIAFGVLGALVLIGSAVGHHFAEQLDLFGLTDGVAFFLLLRMRRYFQIDADALLSIDKRPPILFLRSFEDEERVSYRASNRALFDYSLETRLSRHFAHFGPFVAVGSPDEPLPVPGAARAIMSNADWQNNVRRWMRESQVILMYCGRTYSVNWEMAMLAEMGYLTKTILLFPPRRGWRKRSRKVRDNLKLRLTLLKNALQGTSWAAAAAALEPTSNIRAVFFNADGTLTVVRSRREDREAFHLAVLVCHYLLATPGARTAFRLRAVSHPGRSWPVGGVVSIGAARRNLVVIDDDDYVSGEHARLECRGAHLTLVDLQSRNGTFVNDRPLQGKACRVRPGDRIRFGHSLFEVASEESGGALRKLGPP